MHIKAAIIKYMLVETREGLRRSCSQEASHRLRVVIEIDGGQHNREADAARTRMIEAEGYLIIRFWNNDVLQNSHGCMIQLQEALQ